MEEILIDGKAYDTSGKVKKNYDGSTTKSFRWDIFTNTRAM
jgi:hypothetical protein